jgi:hypothetical protein
MLIDFKQWFVKLIENGINPPNIRFADFGLYLPAKAQ